jgi:calcineurin-like phosphoesterase family protein
MGKVMHNIYIISDTHFGHGELIAKGLRPVGYADKICANIARLNLDAGDVIYHLGDVCVASSSEEDATNNTLFTHVSRAKFVLIRGNHDRRSSGWYLDKGWGAVLDGSLLNIYGLGIYLSHEPMPKNDLFDVNIHGHLHDNLHRADEYVLGKHNILYSCELAHYQPLQLKTLLKGRSL